MDVEVFSPQGEAARGDLAVEVAGIGHSYGSRNTKVQVLKGVNMTVHKGMM